MQGLLCYGKEKITKVKDPDMKLENEVSICNKDSLGRITFYWMMIFSTCFFPVFLFVSRSI